jgi:polysaccharide biosynthesis/export protein
MSHHPPFHRAPRSVSKVVALLLFSTFSLPHPSLAQVPPSELPLPSASSIPTVQSDYVLGAGDQIVVNVFGYEEYTGDRTILPDGTITVPLAGSIQAAGQTTDQLAKTLTDRLQPFLVDPTVTVSLSVLRAVSVNVAGEVLRPGRVQLQSLSQAGLTPSQEGSESPTLSVALTKAGGITQYADIRQVVLQRTGANGQSQSTTINLWDAIGSPNAPPEVVLQDGDSIYIPRLVAGDTTLDRRLVAQSSFAPATVRVRVVGQVTQPGEVAVPPNSSISSAVAIAGGPTEDAQLSRVAFVRMSESGEIQRETLDLRNLTDTYQIQDGDVVIVPKRGSASIIDAAGRIFSPLGVILNLFN